MSAAKTTHLLENRSLFGIIYSYVGPLNFNEYSYTDLNKPQHSEALYALLFAELAKQIPHHFKKLTSPLEQCLVTAKVLDCMDRARTTISNRCSLAVSKLLLHPEAYCREWEAAVNHHLTVANNVTKEALSRQLTTNSSASHVTMDNNKIYTLDDQGTIMIFDYRNARVNLHQLHQTALNNPTLQNLQKQCRDKALPFCKPRGFTVCDGSLTIRYKHYRDWPQDMVETVSLSTFQSSYSTANKPLIIGPKEQRIAISNHRTALAQNRQCKSYGRQCEMDNNLHVAVCQNRMLLFTNSESRSFLLDHTQPIACYDICRNSGIVWMFVRSPTRRVNAECWGLSSLRKLEVLEDIYDFNTKNFKEGTLSKMLTLIDENHTPTFRFDYCGAKKDN